MALLAMGTATASAGGALNLRSLNPRTTLSRDFSRLSFSRTESLASGGSSLSLSATPLAPVTAPDAVSLPLVYCGRGDKKTAKGKRFRHSFGNCRPRNKKRGRGPPRAPLPPSPPKKDKFDDGEIVKINIDESLFS